MDQIEKMSDGSYAEVDDDSDDHISSVLKKVRLSYKMLMQKKIGYFERVVAFVFAFKTNIPRISPSCIFLCSKFLTGNK